jgi:hypothetical protein
MVDVLRREHRVVVLAAGDAHPVLDRAFAGNGVRVEAIPGLRFRYNRKGHLAPLATALTSLVYLRRFAKLLARVRHLIREEGADLAITDFEPSLARAARSTGVPFISLDHQHFLLPGDAHQRGHVAHEAPHVDGDDGASARADRRCDLIGLQHGTERRERAHDDPVLFVEQPRQDVRRKIALHDEHFVTGLQAHATGNRMEAERSPVGQHDLVGARPNQPTQRLTECVGHAGEPLGRQLPGTHLPLHGLCRSLGCGPRQRALVRTVQPDDSVIEIEEPAMNHVLVGAQEA